jgi:hypothetical protein
MGTAFGAENTFPTSPRRTATVMDGFEPLIAVSRAMMTASQTPDMVGT